jgi:hypothetical protein
MIVHAKCLVYTTRTWWENLEFAHGNLVVLIDVIHTLVLTRHRRNRMQNVRPEGRVRKGKREQSQNNGDARRQATKEEGGAKRRVSRRTVDGLEGC